MAVHLGPTIVFDNCLCRYVPELPVKNLSMKRNNRCAAETLRNFLGKVGLDIGLIMGVSTAIAMMGSLVNYDPVAIFKLTYIVQLNIWGGHYRAFVLPDLSGN